MLVSEGALPFVWLIIFNMLIYDHPRDARWISLDERAYLEETLQRQGAELEPVHPEPALRAICRPQVLLLVLIYFLRMSTEIGFLMWLPSALEKAKKLSSAGIGGLATFPFLVAIVAMLVNSWHSDKTGERRGHVALPFALGGMFLLFGSVAEPLLACTCLCLCLSDEHWNVWPAGPFLGDTHGDALSRCGSDYDGRDYRRGKSGRLFRSGRHWLSQQAGRQFSARIRIDRFGLLLVSALCLKINSVREPAAAGT